MKFELAATFMPGCEIDQVAVQDQWLTIYAHTSSRTAACPKCTQVSKSVHSYYTRLPQDLPVGEHAVRLSPGPALSLFEPAMPQANLRRTSDHGA